MKKLQTEFLDKRSEVTAENYYYFLECVPPRAMASNGFLVGEADDHDATGAPRYGMYYTEQGKYYYAGKATLKEYTLWILPAQSLLEAIESKDKEAQAQFMDDMQSGKVTRII